MSSRPHRSKATVFKPRPRQFGRLVQLYLMLKELSTVITSLSSNATGVDVKDFWAGHQVVPTDLWDLYQDQAVLEAEAKRLVNKLALPRWNDLDPAYKQATKLTLMANNPDAVFFTINLGPEAVALNLWTDFKKELKQSRTGKGTRGGTLRLADALRAILRELGLPTTLAMNVEQAAPRRKNPDEHIHGILYLNPWQYPPLIKALKNTLSFGYEEHSSHKAVLFKRVHSPGTCAGYACKDLQEQLPFDTRRSYASQDTVAPAKDLYKEFRRWCQEIKIREIDPVSLFLPSPVKPGRETVLQQLVRLKQDQIAVNRIQRSLENREWSLLKKRRKAEKKLQEQEQLIDLHGKPQEAA